MTPAEILAEAAARGFQVSLNHTGDRLMLWPGDDPPADLVDLLRSAKPQIIAVLQNERGRINRWIASRIISWPPDRCLHCKRPILPGSKWVPVAAGGNLARFHEPCHSEWLAQQEALARKALGMREMPKC